MCEMQAGSHAALGRYCCWTSVQVVCVCGISSHVTWVPADSSGSQELYYRSSEIIEEVAQIGMLGSDGSGYWLGRRPDEARMTDPMGRYRSHLHTYVPELVLTHILYERRPETLQMSSRSSRLQPKSI